MELSVLIFPSTSCFISGFTLRSHLERDVSLTESSLKLDSIECAHNALRVFLWGIFQKNRSIKVEQNFVKTLLISIEHLLEFFHFHFQFLSTPTFAEWFFTFLVPGNYRFTQKWKKNCEKRKSNSGPSIVWRELNLFSSCLFKSTFFPVSLMWGLQTNNQQ